MEALIIDLRSKCHGLSESEGSPPASVTHKPVSDLVADHAEHQESRQEGVEEQKVQRVSGQSSRIPHIDDLVALGDRTAPRPISRNIWKNRDTRGNVLQADLGP